VLAVASHRENAHLIPKFETFDISNDEPAITLKKIA